LETNLSVRTYSRRRSKVLRFIVAEIFALALVLLAGAFVVSARPANPMVVTLLNVLMLTAASAAAAIPIFFFALAPTLPRSRR